jgi:hypothetical protein
MMRNQMILRIAVGMSSAAGAVGYWLKMVAGSVVSAGTENVVEPGQGTG